MSSPIINLKKTSLASEKIIKNGLEFRNKGPMSMEAEVYYVRRNSPPDLMDKENIMLNMSNRLTNLENEMMGVRYELSKAVEVINKKDAEISMLKQFFQQGNQPIRSPIPVADKRGNNVCEEYKYGYIKNPDRCYYDRPNIDWEQKYYDLLDRIGEMEKFLADYGMIWVGEKKRADGQAGIVQTAVDFVPNFDKVIPIIDELNERTSSESHIKVVRNEARFQKADVLNITFYNDGMKLENNHFRKYSTESALVFFQDLEDGYYPTELKESYPEGVIFKVTNKRSKPYEVPKQEESLFSIPGYTLGTQASSVGEPNQAQVYFQFDMDTNKQVPHKVILQEKPFGENVLPATLKQDSIVNYFDPNESRHDGLHNDVKINQIGDKGYVLNRSSCKEIRKEYIESKEKLTQNKRDLKNVSKKPTTNFKNKGVRYDVPVGSQSAPVLLRKVNEHYDPTGHPQQSRTINHQEDRVYANKGRGHGHKMNYDTISQGSTDDSTTMNTIYDDSYSRNDYKKKIYDATAELAQNRPKLPVQKDPYDTDEKFENMIILGKKRKRNNGNYDDSCAIKSHTEGKVLKSRVSTDSEYGVYSRNIEDIRASIGARSSIRNSITDPHGLRNSFNDNMTQEGQQLHSETKRINVRKSFSIGQTQRPNIIPSSDKTSYGQAKPNMKSYNASKDDDEMRSDTSTMDTEYDRRYSQTAEDIAISIEKRHSLRRGSTTSYDDESQEVQKQFKGNNFPSTEKRPPEGKVATQKMPINKKSSDKSRSSIKSYGAYKDDEMRSDTSTMGTEYDRRYSQTAEDIAISIEKRRSLRHGSTTSYDDESQEVQKQFKGNNFPSTEKRPPEGKVATQKMPINKKSSDKSRSSIKSYGEYEEQENRRSSFKNPSAKEHDAYDKSNVVAFNERRGFTPGDMDSYDNDKKSQNMYQQEEMQNKFKARNDPNAVKELSKENVYKQNLIVINDKTSKERKVKSNMTPYSENEKQGSDDDDMSMATEYHESYSHNIGNITDTFEKHISLKPGGQDLIKFQRNIDPDDETLFSGKITNKINIVPSNKRSSVGANEEEDSRSNSPMTTEYDNAYSKIEDTLMGDKSRLIDNSGSKKSDKGRGQIVIINSNKESENFVLGNEDSKSPLTSEYRDAYGAKFKYVIHQCSTNLLGEEMLDNRDGSIESNFIKMFSKGKFYEPKIIPLNNKTSDGQIELHMKSHNGKEIYSAYLYPDDSISKVWSLTELSCEDFVVTVDDKVLHINVPLKNYNINGDVTLNISKRKPSFVIKEDSAYKTKSCGDEGDFDYAYDEDYFSEKVDNEEGYSS